jgi:hypothetical protein
MSSASISALLCVTWNTNGQKLGMNSMELLKMINRKTVRSKAVIAGLARELDSDVSYPGEARLRSHNGDNLRHSGYLYRLASLEVAGR